MSPHNTKQFTRYFINYLRLRGDPGWGTKHHGWASKVLRRCGFLTLLDRWLHSPELPITVQVLLYFFYFHLFFRRISCSPELTLSFDPPVSAPDCWIRGTCHQSAGGTSQGFKLSYISSLLLFYFFVIYSRYHGVVKYLIK